MANILERVVDGSLKTNSTWWDMHGAHPSILIEAATKHWGWVLFTVMATIVGVASAVAGLF